MNTILSKSLVRTTQTISVSSLQFNICGWFGGHRKGNVHHGKNKGINSLVDDQTGSIEMTEEQKREVLKTYLQIIPPYRLSSLICPEKLDIKQFISLAESRPLSQDELKRAYQKIKKNVHMMMVEDLQNFIEAVHRHDLSSQMQPATSVDHIEQSQQDLKSKRLIKKIETRIISTIKKKVHILTLEQIISFLYKLVKSNLKDFELMKDIERRIIEQKIPIQYPLIRKLLWSYTHLDAGSSVLYSHVAKTIRIGQHQLSPIELAESAYMLSKVSENASGGYGIFLIASKHIEDSLPRLQFAELVKAAFFMFTQNLGTNSFQCKLEESIYSKYPDKASLTINSLTSLLKSTSSYYFKYRENALLHMLKTFTQRMAEFATLEQFEDMIWSWGRAGKGDRQLWEILETVLQQKHLKHLKPRQTAFFYYSIASTQYSSKKCLELLEKKFLQQLEQSRKGQTGEYTIDHHYILKLLLGMEKQKDYKNETLLHLTSILCSKMAQLSPKELVSFTRMINESDLHYQSKQDHSSSGLVQQIERQLQRGAEQSILQRVYLFTIRQLVEILYMYIKLDIESQCSFQEKMFAHLRHELINIPKSVFIQALFCHVVKDKYEPALEMIPILYELMKYGRIGYFFSPHQMPLLAYCLFHLQVNSRGSIKISKSLLLQIGDILKDINPVILNSFVMNGYQEALRLYAKWENDQY